MPGSSRRISAWSRWLGCGAAGAVVGLMLTPSGPVVAQIPDLLPSTTTTAPGSTTTTLLPPLITEETLTPGPPPTGNQPAPAPALLPPAPAPTTSRTTTFTTTPIPPRTARARTTPTTVQRSVRPTTTAAPAPLEQEAGDPNAPVDATLPYAPGDEATVGAADGSDMELGLDEVGADNVASLASVAAGLLAAVLLGVVVWIQRQVRHPSGGAGDLEPDW